METITVFEAKSRLSEILAAVEHGEEFTVTKRGHLIALIVPYRQAPTDAAMARSRAPIPPVYWKAAAASCGM